MVGVAVKVTLLPSHIVLLPVVSAMLTLATIGAAAASVIVIAVAASYLDWLSEVASFTIPYIFMLPVPATGAVQGMDSV